VSLTDDITDPRIAKALAHPLRVEILRRLGNRTASPSEIAEEIGAPLTNVSYHVRKLRTLGLIKLVKKTPKRGVIEHYYSALPRTTVTEEAWREIPDVVKEALVTPTARRVAEEILRAAAEGGFNRHNAHFVRQQNKLDERGWADAAKLLDKFYDDLAETEQKAIARIDSGETKEINATLVLGFFETAESTPRDGVPSPGAGARTGASDKRAKVRS
jgi:DNA-binding transcriptional ArsR family regulator